MKTAIYIEDGVAQLIITPETEFEKNSLSTFKDKPLDVKLFTGSFYDCRGGWIRQSAYRQNVPSYSDKDDESIILTVKQEVEPT